MAERNNLKAAICDFLNGSSINGLIHVSNASRPWAKCGWMFVISLGFFMAGYLIQGSFVSWSRSPFITTIETLPISNAPLPVVTVCPPKDTNTALNYDILASQNITLTNKTRMEALKVARQLIYESILMQHVKDNQNWAEEEHTIQAFLDGTTQLDNGILDGTITYNDGKFIPATGISGSVRTPNFNESFDRDRYDSLLMS